MTPINLAIVGLRVLAVYCFIQAVPLFSAFGLVAALFAPDSFRGSIFTSLLPGGSLLILAIVLFIFLEPLARRLVSSPPSDAKEGVCTFEQLQTLAFAVAGILILTTSLPGLGAALRDLFILYSHQKQGDTNPADRVFSNALYSVGVFAQLIIGFMLFLNPKGFRNAWQWLRTAGT